MLKGNFYNDPKIEKEIKSYNENIKIADELSKSHSGCFIVIDKGELLFASPDFEEVGNKIDKIKKRSNVFISYIPKSSEVMII